MERRRELGIGVYVHRIQYYELGLLDWPGEMFHPHQALYLGAIKRLTADGAPNARSVRKLELQMALRGR